MLDDLAFFHQKEEQDPGTDSQPAISPITRKSTSPSLMPERITNDKTYEEETSPPPSPNSRRPTMVAFDPSTTKKEYYSGSKELATETPVTLTRLETVRTVSCLLGRKFDRRSIVFVRPAASSFKHSPPSSSLSHRTPLLPSSSGLLAFVVSLSTATAAQTYQEFDAFGHCFGRIASTRQILCQSQTVALSQLDRMQMPNLQCWTVPKGSVRHIARIDGIIDRCTRIHCRCHRSAQTKGCVRRRLFRFQQQTGS